MKHSIVEVIVYLLEIASSQVTKAEGPCAAFDTEFFQQKLEDAGFSQEIVTDTFDWLKELIEQQCWYAGGVVGDSVDGNKTLRIFDPVEKARLNPEVRSFILSLECTGILDTKMREIVISQLMQLNHRFIELTDAKWVILLVLMSKLNRNIQEMRSYFLATVVSGV